MIWVLKTILVIFLLADVLCFRYFLKDWNNTRKSDTYENTTPFEKLRFNGVFMMVFMALAALAVFLGYFIMSQITAIFPVW